MKQLGGLGFSLAVVVLVVAASRPRSLAASPFALP